jgi:S-formylglutathione hydrolase FrmB
VRRLAARGGARLAIALLVALAAGAAPAVHGARRPIPSHRFRIALSPLLADRPVAGRLFVLMEEGEGDQPALSTGFLPGPTWLAAMEVPRLAPGQAFEFDADRLAYPRPFSQAPPGRRRCMALLDPDHSYPYTGRNDGDLYGPVVGMPDPDPAAPVTLLLSRRVEPPAALGDTAFVRGVEVESELLAAFWGRPVRMRAGVVLPPGHDREPTRAYPAVYHVHGFGGNHEEAWARGPRLAREMAAGGQPEMVHVFLDGSCPAGHHAFVDSANNGPWGSALTRELIPRLERRFRLLPRPNARFLTGHSSGGWSTLWLQVTYPDFFGGTWSTAPDPVDFRRFIGVDVTPGSTENLFRTVDGRPRNLARAGGRPLCSVEEFARYEAVQGEVGGQLAAFEWAFSPRGPGGRPRGLFDRATGALDPAVQRAWEPYDLRRLLERNWSTLGPKLQGKLHLFCGAEDTFHLEEAVQLFAGFLRRYGSDANCELVPGRDHGNLYAPAASYPDGLDARIATEMQTAFSRASGPKSPAEPARSR